MLDRRRRAKAELPIPSLRRAQSLNRSPYNDTLKTLLFVYSKTTSCAQPYPMSTLSLYRRPFKLTVAEHHTSFG